MKKFFTIVSVFFMLAQTFADKQLVLKGSDGTVKVSVPDEIAEIYVANKAEIDSAISDSTKAEIANVASEITNAYNKSKSALGTLSPYTTAKNGLNDFCAELCNVLPNTQAQQNVWAKSWIGYLIPKPHFGLGVNAGAAVIDISSITRTIRALGMNTSDFPEKFIMPTVSADARIGGFFLPFDIGFTICGLDTSVMGLDSKIKPVTASYFSVGGDLRYNVLDLKAFETRISAGAGFYYTKGSIRLVDDEFATGKFDFNATTIFLSAQISAKFLIFVPFAGTKVMFSKSEVEWAIDDIKWKNIFSGNYESAIEKAIEWNLLPRKIGGGADSGFFEDIHPIVFGGLGLDAGPIDITFSGSFDIPSRIAGAAFSLRVAL